MYLFDLLFIIGLLLVTMMLRFFYSSYASNSLLYLHGYIRTVDDR
nr:hypothetical protein [Priestia aryabhattai]MDH3111014.1 hypothetical protein [Priestia aryabhattai]MDH3124588.1 hypothetical protein [Priestia aryabhattai]